MSEETIFHIAELVFYAVTVLSVAYYLPILVTIFVFVPLCLKVYTRLTVGMCRSIKRLDGKTVIITGANTGLGLETAKDIARRGAAKVILACRNIEKGNEAANLIKRETGNTNISVKSLDLTSLSSVRKFASEIKSEEEKIDILINNAGAATRTKVITKDKMEANFQANHFGPFLLTNLLLDVLRKAENAKIINLSSEMHKLVRTFDFENLNSEKDWSPAMVYARTKVANILFTRELHSRLQSAGINITVNAVHPGAVRTEFLRYTDEILYMRIMGIVQKFFFKNVVEGVQTTIYSAVSEEVEGVSGEYFSDCQKMWITSVAKNPEFAKKLWDYSAKLVNLKSDETIVK